MSVQQTLIIVKPDGIAKGLVGQILRKLQENELRVVEHTRVQLSRKWVESLYGNEREEIYFKDVVEWVSSALVLFMKIEGDDAVDKVKRKIIGRYPDGIRGLHSENWIKNVAHAPDSTQSAIHELELSKQIFESSASVDKNRLGNKVIFALTGMSECGKSTVGEYLDSMGIKRLKIVKLFERIHTMWSPDQEFYEFLSQQEERDPYALWDAFIDELLMEMEHLKVRASSVESLYGGGLGPYLRQKLGDHFHILFIDISQAIRLRRQMQRENLSNIEDAKKYLLPRDKVKEKSGIPALKDISDEVIDNSVTLKRLHRDIDLIINKYL